MLLSFIGAPCSGKTTVGALVFAALKDAGQAVEFIPEVARSYIAWKRIQADCLPPKPLSLEDRDQWDIVQSQIKAERTFVTACPQSIIVTDSSPLNTLLYMQDTTHALKDVKQYLEDLKPIVFYCPPLPSTAWPYDPGRIHDEATSRLLDQKISTQLFPLLPSPPETLSAHTARLRSNQVLNTVWNKLGEAVRDHLTP